MAKSLRKGFALYLIISASLFSSVMYSMSHDTGDESEWSFLLPRPGQTSRSLLTLESSPLVGRVVQAMQRQQESPAFAERSTVTSSSSSSSSSPSSSSSSSSSTSTGIKRKPEEEKTSKEQHKARKLDSPQLTAVQLLKNTITIPAIDFTREKLAVLENRENIGSLTITPNPGFPIHGPGLIQRIEHYFPNVLYVNLSGLRLEDAGFRALTRSRLAEHLLMLGVTNCHITSQSFTQENLDKFKRLITLIVSNNQLGDAGFRALIESTLAAQLKALGLSNTGITDESFKPQYFSRFRNLTILDIIGNRLRKREVITALKNAGLYYYLKELRADFDKSHAHEPEAPTNEELFENSLSIPLENFTEENLIRSNNLKYVGALEIIPGKHTHVNPIKLIKLIERFFPYVLDLRLNNIILDDEGFESLVNSRFASRLLELQIAKCKISSAVTTTENFNRLPKLAVLVVSDNKLEDAGFQALAQSTIAQNLVHLALTNCRISDRVFTQENLNRFVRLQKLLLGENFLSDKAFDNLTQSNIASQLITLSIQNLFVTSSSFTRENLNRFTNLRRFYIDGNMLGQAGYNALKESNVCNQRKLKMVTATNTGFPHDTFTCR